MYGEREPLPFLGDTSFVHTVEEMGRAAVPVIEWTRVESAHPSRDRLSITAAGRVVLRRETDWLALDPPPRWVGGVQIRAGQPVWRWDEDQQDVGDPMKEGAPYVIRLRSTPGTRLPVHWHPNDEHITVLSGTWCAGMGNTFDERACRDMPAGSYIFVPKGMRHFAVARGNIVQIHGIGPFKAIFVN